MKCSSCGANYDDKFAFCPYCGTAKPQAPTVRVLVEEPQYEYCQLRELIVKTVGFFNMYHVKALEATGTGGNASHIYGRSRGYVRHTDHTNTARWNKEHEAYLEARSEFICELERQGWREHDLTHQIFRRRIA